MLTVAICDDDGVIAEEINDLMNLLELYNT